MALPRTLNAWLMSMGEEYRELRQLWIDNMLAEAKEEIDNVTDNFPLARARTVKNSNLVR